MREIILNLQKVKNGKKVDINVTGSVAGCTATLDKANGIIDLYLPTYVYTYVADCEYDLNIEQKDAKTHIMLPDNDNINMSLLIKN